MSRKIGKISYVLRQLDFDDFEWRIENFASLPAKQNYFYVSPSFSFAGETWSLEMYPNGQKKADSVGYIDMYLFRESGGAPIDQDYTFILKIMNEKLCEKDCFFVFKNTRTGGGENKLLKRSEYFKRRFELNLPDVFIVICRMIYDGNIGDKNENATAQCSNCKNTSTATSIPSHETKVPSVLPSAHCEAIKCPVCRNDIKLKHWNDHECQKSNTEAIEKLLYDLKEMMQSGDNSDTIIKVKGEEFQLHRSILMARNLYFKSMFKNDMKEKSSGIVTIDDCEPDIFRIFVHFIYTGKVDKLSPENVCELYETTDKYQEDQLKKDCLEFMMKTISEDSFCDYIALALKYDEKKLFEKCVEFLVSKPKDIVRSVKWQIFAKEYPTQANELIIKTLDHLVK